MTKYSVKQLSKLAGVSIRSLHYYDKIGLLKPAFRSEKGYRYYGRDELLKLQQILFYKELDFSLAEISEIFEDEDFDLVEALRFHRKELENRARRLGKLLTTIDKTIVQLQSKEKMMTDQEMYEGFSKDEVQHMREEVIEKWGEEELLATEERIKALGKDGWKDTKKKGEDIVQLLADLMPLGTKHEKVQKAIALYHQYMNTFYEVDETRYRGLGQMYVDDERFTAYYEKYREGLAAFVKASIDVYCDNGMKVVINS